MNFQHPQDVQQMQGTMRSCSVARAELTRAKQNVVAPAVCYC
jgi:hypothetical protein